MAIYRNVYHMILIRIIISLIRNSRVFNYIFIIFVNQVIKVWHVCASVIFLNRYYEIYSKSIGNTSIVQIYR